MTYISWSHACLKNKFTEDEKYHNLMSWLIYVKKSKVKPLLDCHDISGDMRRYKASYNSSYIVADVHEL